MQPENKEIIIYNWLMKADEALEEAQKAVSSESFSSAQNRIYYAIFYSVMALGYSKDFITSKHSQLLGWFNKTFIKEDIFDKSLAKTYKIAYEDRMKSDYTFTYKPTKERTLQAYNNANKFVSEIKVYILKNTPTP